MYRTTEKSTKYAIRSLNNGDLSREMAFFEHVLQGCTIPPILLLNIEIIEKVLTEYWEVSPYPHVQYYYFVWS